MARLLSRNYRVTLVDFYGFGETPHPPHPLVLDDFVNSVVELINFYGMRDVTLISHSFGGRVALKLAWKYGYLLNKLVLIDSAGIKPRRGPKYYCKVYTHKLLAKLKIPHKAGSSDYRSLPENKRKTFVNIVNEDLKPILSKITLPSLILWGEQDRDTPLYMAKALNKGIAGSGLVVIKDAGHYCYLDAIRETFFIVDNFLAGGVD